jgi:hypothetical protein
VDFFHGSSVGGIAELLPFSSPHSNMGFPCVYLTTSRHLALHYIWDSHRCPIRMPMLDIRDNDLLVFQEMFSGALAYFYRGLKGYIYHCIGDYEITKEVGVAICAVSRAPVPVHDCETIADVYEEILSYEQRGLFVYERYESLSAHRYALIHDAIIRLIKRLSLLECPESDSSRFVRSRFPEYWEEATRSG